MSAGGASMLIIYNNILLEMILVNQGYDIQSKEYSSEYVKYTEINDTMINKLYVTMEEHLDQELTDLCHNILENKNLGPSQWKSIIYMLDNKDISGLENLMDNIDREQSEMYAEYISTDEFVCDLRCPYWLKYHNK